MSSPLDADCATTEPVCYCPDRANVWQGILLTFGFVAFGVFGFFLAISDPTIPHPVLMAIFVSAVPFAMALMSVWMIVSYYLQRLHIAPDAIMQHGCFATRTLQTGKITAVDWNRWPAPGRILLWCGEQRISIYLGNFSRADRREVIARVRHLLSPELQRCWTAFEQYYFPTVPRVQESVWNAVACAAMFFVSGIGLGYCWYAGLGVQWLLIGLCCFGASGTYWKRIARWRARRRAKGAQAPAT